MRFFTVLCLLLCFSLSLSATTFYVDGGSGSNSNPGTQAQPWRTVQYGIDQLAPGDTVFVNSGSYFEKITFNNSGTPGNPIVLTGPLGTKPTLVGDPFTPSGRDGLITVRNKSYIVIENMEVINFKTSDVNQTPVGILVEGIVQDLEIRTCSIFAIEQNATSGIGGANAIGVYGTNAVLPISGLKIIGNDIASIKTFWSEVITLNGNVRDFEVADNFIENCNNIGIDFIGWEGECLGCSGTTGPNVDRARDGWVHGNVILNIDTKDNPAYGGERNAAGIYVDGGADIIIEGNRIQQCNFGIELASEHYQQTTDGIIVRSNIISNNHLIGITTGGYDSGSGAGGGSATNCYVINNTCYQNHQSTRPQDDYGGELTIANRNVNNVYQNNIFYATSGFDRADEWGTLNSANTFGNNLYFGSTEGTTPGMISSADPMLNTSSEFPLLAGSPAIDVGDNLSTNVIGQFEYDGVTPRIIGGMVDLGAREFGTPTSVDPASISSEMVLYPNPGGTFRFIQVSKGTVVKSVQIFDLAGKQVQADVHPNPSGDILIHLPDLPVGVYQVRVTTQKGIQVLRMLI